MRTTVQLEKLKALFQSYRDRNDGAFIRIAEQIIGEELAANHHTSATELQKALGNMRRSMTPLAKLSDISPVSPKDRRNGEELLSFIETPKAPTVFFTKESKQKIDRILEEHKRATLLQKHGYSPKTKLLFWGPPGCGKTITAQYLAFELGLPLAVVRLNAVISSFLGDTASHLHRIFARAESTPMVLLLDEADALAKHRDDPNDVGELKRVVNSFLQALDTFSSAQSILVAASNHQYLFDPALWRRFDDVVEFTQPSISERQAFIKHLLNGVRFEGLPASVAKQMSGMSYSEIQSIIVESIKSMILGDKEVLSSRDILAELSKAKRATQKARTRGRARSK